MCVYVCVCVCVCVRERERERERERLNWNDTEKISVVLRKHDTQILEAW